MAIRTEDKKRKKKEARSKHRLAMKKTALTTKRLLLQHQKIVEFRDRKAAAKDERESLALSAEDKVVIPPRNGPCPMHPDNKFKSCPHGCLAVFKRSKDRQDGVVYVEHVDPNDKRAGKLGVEVDAGASVMNDLASALGGL